MKSLYNFHTHTQYVHGDNTAEEMVLAAIGKGFVALGFSEHGYLDCDDRCRMTIANTALYCQEIRALKEKYAEQIELYLGLENDSLGQVDVSGFEYSIGSVHNLFVPHGVVCVDSSASEICDVVARWFGGDPMLLVRAYYLEYMRMAASMRPDILGHFDVITKNNGEGNFFDEASPRYRALALEALDAALDTGAILEVNTGGMYRKKRDVPYPAPFLLEHAKARNANIMLCSDAHSVDWLDYGFQEVSAMLKEIGFREQMVLSKQGFVPVAL